MEYLVLGPAGMGIFTIVGSLMKYEDDLKHIKEISGASAGAAILAVALALSIPLHDVLDRLLDLDFANLTKFKIKSFVSTFGFVDMAPVRETLVKAYGCDPNVFRTREEGVHLFILHEQSQDGIFFGGHTSTHEGGGCGVHEPGCASHILHRETRRDDIHGWRYQGMLSHHTIHG
jgi:hypothetical protein